MSARTVLNTPVGVVLGVTLLGALARVGLLLTLPAGADRTLLPDEEQYWNMAAALAGGEGLRDELGFRATRMPLYPAFLSLFAGREGGHRSALMVQAVLSSLACGLCSVMAWQVRGSDAGPAVPLLAGVFVAVDPFLVYLCRFHLTENLFIPALCGFLVAVFDCTRRDTLAGFHRWTIPGVLFALCVYLRPSCAALLPCACLWILWKRGVSRRTVAVCCWMSLILVAALSPWANRNRRVIDHWTWLTTRFGISLYDGLGPQADGSSDLEAVKWTAARDGDEVAWNRHFRSESWRQVTREPLRAAALAVKKLQRTWNPWPNAAGYGDLWLKLIGGVWTLMVLGTAIVGVLWCWRCDDRTVVWLLLPALYFTALHMVFVGSVRYRLPAMPMVELLSALGVRRLLWSWWGGRRTAAGAAP